KDLSGPFAAARRASNETKTCLAEFLIELGIGRFGLLIHQRRGNRHHLLQENDRRVFLTENFHGLGNCSRALVQRLLPDLVWAWLESRTPILEIFAVRPKRIKTKGQSLAQRLESSSQTSC